MSNVPSPPTRGSSGTPRFTSPESDACAFIVLLGCDFAISFHTSSKVAGWPQGAAGLHSWEQQAVAAESETSGPCHSSRKVRTAEKAPGNTWERPENSLASRKSRRTKSPSENRTEFGWSISPALFPLSLPLSIAIPPVNFVALATGRMEGRDPPIPLLTLTGLKRGFLNLDQASADEDRLLPNSDYVSDSGDSGEPV